MASPRRNRHSGSEGSLARSSGSGKRSPLLTFPGLTLTSSSPAGTQASLAVSLSDPALPAAIDPAVVWPRSARSVVVFGGEGGVGRGWAAGALNGVEGFGWDPGEGLKPSSKRQSSYTCMRGVTMRRGQTSEVET